MFLVGEKEAQQKVYEPLLLSVNKLSCRRLSFSSSLHHLSVEMSKKITSVSSWLHESFKSLLSSSHSFASSPFPVQTHLTKVRHVMHVCTERSNMHQHNVWYLFSPFSLVFCLSSLPAFVSLSSSSNFLSLSVFSTIISSRPKGSVLVCVSLCIVSFHWVLGVCSYSTVYRA